MENAFYFCSLFQIDCKLEHLFLLRSERIEKFFLFSLLGEFSDQRSTPYSLGILAIGGVSYGKLGFTVNNSSSCQYSS